MANNPQKDAKDSEPATVLLESNDHRDLLDIIDRLRSQGISRYVDLPQIIVCGDQSSGKSSVLEAISGMSFPTKDNLCTRFATELILRRGSTKATTFSIVPATDRSEEEKQRLRAFTYSSDADEPCLGKVVEEAKVEMGLSGANSGKVFSTDILRVELSGPKQPHLTMVDLPGLFKAGNREQSDEDAALVTSLVLSYMKRPRSIILAVVSAKSDFALQEVTKYARELDPQGTRTLGLITKPDTLDEGSDSERAYLELAQNSDVKFRLGWHVLRNRDFAMRNASSAERDEAEAEFFSRGIWTSLDSAQLGVATLRPRLSHVLKDQILIQLPNLLEDIEVGIQDCKGRLERLGAPRGTLSDQRRYLLHISHNFSNLIKAAVDGMYGDSFFGVSKTSDGYRKRLRAVVQNTLVDFSEQMRCEGHAKEIIETASKYKPRQVSRSQYLEEVKTLMRRSRGCELPGTFNPLIVGELFSEQCRPWKGLVERYTRCIVDAASHTVNTALEYVADERTSEGLLQEIINPAMDQLKRNLKRKVAEILEPHQTGHPITYNHYLTENVQKAQLERRKHDLERRLKDFFGTQYSTSGVWNYNFEMKSLLNALFDSTEADMDRYACSAAIDMMQAYYKVALKKVVDDISVLAIERCLVQELPLLFSPAAVYDLEDTDIQKIASEGEESIVERTRLAKKLNVLENGLGDLKRLDRHHVSSLTEDLKSANASESISGDEVTPELPYTAHGTEAAVPPLNSLWTEAAPDAEDSPSVRTFFSKRRKAKK